ncbi:hypothetical protein LCGC14_1170560 [marine sediment metagenome]|uniref:Phage portal protein n=1 Tax=marine sediment metagenome TaxID=412755 RepID=A0A0F9LQ20_9ZZZZ
MFLDRLFSNSRPVDTRHQTGKVVTGAGVGQDARLKAVFGPGPETLAGVPVTPRSALGIAAFFAGVRLISQTTAMLPVGVFRELKDNDREIVKVHQVSHLFNRHPNPTQTPMVFRELTTLYILLWGNSYNWIQVDGAGELMALWPLHPRDVVVTQDPKTLKLKYDISAIQDPPTSKKILADFEVLHVPGLGFDGLVGQSIVSYAREQLGESIATQNFSSGFYAGGAEPTMILRHPMSLDDETMDRFRRNWRKHHGSGRKELAVLDEDMDIKGIGIPPRDAQYLESREFQVKEAARWLDIPLFMLADTARTATADISQQKISWFESLLPWTTKWEQEINRKLLLGEDDLFTEYDIESLLLRTDAEKRHKAYGIALQWGWMNRNQVRKKERENSMGPDGDLYMRPANMVVGTEEDRLKREQDMLDRQDKKVEDAQKAAAKKVPDVTNTTDQTDPDTTEKV